ncbi:hypothetical protein [Lysinibacillus sp. BSL11]
MIEKELINFFKAIKMLRDSEIIRSDKYLGDIGEYICQKLYGITLNKSGREKGYDGTLGSEKYEIKFHNSLTRTNIYLGNPEIYDVLLVVLGPDSLLRPQQEKDDFLIYRTTNMYVKNHFKQKSGYCCGKSYFEKSKVDKIYNLS